MNIHEQVDMILGDEFAAVVYQPRLGTWLRGIVGRVRSIFGRMATGGARDPTITLMLTSRNPGSESRVRT